MEENHELWMTKAIANAKKSNTPYGAVLLNAKGEFVEAYNTVKKDGATAHAEINVLLKIKDLKFEKENELILYSTVEPCPMCMSAIIWSGIGTVVYGADIPFASKHGNQIQLRAKKVIESSWRDTKLIEGILSKDCEQLFLK